ncbi:MAG: toll/interleukin-1 receptor domain-containing protein [Sulfurospirillaceae bacterium]|nr:toll/interleukin-1 receptor domain-containing protein [Sulfurospirillaceae bacterium]
MSIASTTSSINQLNKEIASLEKAMTDELKKEADKSKKINDIRRSINKNTSVSSLQSKSRQIDTYSTDLAKIASKKADINKKLSDKKSKLSTLNLKLQKEQQDDDKKRAKEQEKIRQSYETRINTLTSQMEQSVHMPFRNSYPEDREENKAIEKYDVFISHASEDKDSFVRELATTLQDKYNIKVWYDELSIKWGDSLRMAIDKGLSNSKFGIVVISKSFIKKGWTNYELDGLFQIEMTNGKTILPIWHDITKDEVQAFSATLAGRKALNTAMFTIDEIADELHKILKGE